MTFISQDILWKYIIEGRFESFLGYFFQEYVGQIDHTRGYEFLDKELQKLFPESSSRNRQVDKLIKVWLKDGGEHWFLIHVEVQGWDDPAFSRRMYQYHYRIFDRYNVFVTSLAILTDRRRNWKPNKFKWQHMGTTVFFEFNLYKVVAIARQDLLAVNNIFAVLILASQDALKTKWNDKRKLDAKLSLAHHLLEKGYVREDITDVLSFIRYYSKFEDAKFYRIFDEEIDKITNPIVPMNLIEAIQLEYQKAGLAEGRAVGIAEGKAELAKITTRICFLQGMSKREIRTLLRYDLNLIEAVEQDMKDKGEAPIAILLEQGFSKTEIQEKLGVEQDLIEDVEADLHRN